MRIAELGSLHPEVKMTKKALIMNSLSIARYMGVDNQGIPLFLQQAVAASSSHFFDAELLEDESDEPLGELPSIKALKGQILSRSNEAKLLIRETAYCWCHFSPGMFIHNFLRMTKEDHNLDLANLASYFADLLTGFSSSLNEFKSWPGHLAPSLIALGSLAAAKQTLGLSETHWQDLLSEVCIQRYALLLIHEEEEVEVARDGALYLHNRIKGNFHHPVFQKHHRIMGSKFLDLTTNDEYQQVEAINALSWPSLLG